MNTKRILFASMPLEGHFNPLTGLAVHLQRLGYDVRWYTGPSYADKVHRLGLPFYPYQQAIELNQDNFDEIIPERKQIKGAIAKLRFDINHAFLLRVPEFVADLTSIHQEWPFELLVCDVAFTGAPFIRQLLNVPVAAVGVVPLIETSRDLPPSGMGLTPMRGVLGRPIQALLRYLITHHLLKTCTDQYNQLLQAYGLPKTAKFLFDAMIQHCDVLLQSGAPGFEYPRSDMSETIRFVGPMLPYTNGVKRPFADVTKARMYERVVLVTQGTVERDATKLIVPTLDAFKNDSRTLVIVTTGGSQTAELRERYPQENVIIEDFIDFNSVMPYTDVYVTNAGYGGVMLSLQHGLPMVAAGVHEGKNEIAARVGYVNVGVNLKTERPTARQIQTAVEEVLTNRDYKRNAQRLRAEFKQYNPNALCTKYITDLLEKQPVVREPVLNSVE
ncbi:glycosyltransferase [Spirosoma migulaei]